MQKNLIQASFIALAVMASFPAFASKDQSGGCQGNCPTTGGNGPISNTNTNTATGGTGIGVGVGIGLGGAGGQGGQGGKGGNSSAAVVGSGNSKNDNTNVNVSSNVNGQKQGQKQKQNQGQKQSSFNSNDSTSYGSVATTANSVQVEGDQVQYQAARIPVATAYAPNIAPTAVCMGSTSMGGQGMSFGFSLGTSWTDANCMLLEQVRTVSVVLGQKEVAAEMMMAIPAYADAVQRLQGKGKATDQAATGTYTGAQVSSKVEYTDPIVRARLNLPPLK